MDEPMATLLEELRLEAQKSAIPQEFLSKLDPILHRMSALELAATPHENTAEDALRLHNITIELVEASQTAQMLLVLYKYLGQHIRNLTLTDVVYGKDGLPTGLVLRYVIDAQGNLTEPNLQLSRSMSPEVVIRIVEEMQRVGTQLEVVEDTQDSPNPMHGQFLLQGIRSMVTIPILEEERRTIQITFTWEKPRAFDQRFLNMLRSTQTQFTIILQNRRLIEKMNNSAEQSENQMRGLRLLSQISDITNRATDEATMLSLAAQALHDYVQVDHIGVVTIHESSGETRLVAEYPVTAMIGAVLPNDENSLTAILRRTRHEVVIQDIENSDQITPELRDILLSVGSRSMFLQPLHNAEGDLIGSIGFDINRPFAIPDAIRMEFARTVAAQLALTLQKMRLYDNSQRQVAQIQKINRFNLSVQVSQDVSTVLLGLVALARSLVPFDYVALHLYNREVGALGVATLYDNGELTIPSAFTPSYPDQNLLLQQTYLDNTVSIVRDLETETLWTHPKRGSIRTLSVYPLVAQRHTFGALELGSKRPYAYTVGEFTIFQQLANQTAATLSNAMTFQQTTQQAQRKLRTTELATLMQQQTDLGSMMRVTVEALGQMLGARRASIRLGTNAPQTEKK